VGVVMMRTVKAVSRIKGSKSLPSTRLTAVATLRSAAVD
jgi:hypothetical protein